ncbi:hypothetical protein YW3DRAFT_00952 [Streptomyces sp. MnatMP-M77]|nr:hypothetical protein YW3DRAFT_00952 [Streptomyces sp. MnatMP-M77]
MTSGKPARSGPDSTFPEGKSQVRCGKALRASAGFRNLAISAVPLAGRAGIARTRRGPLHRGTLAPFTTSNQPS